MTHTKSGASKLDYNKVKTIKMLFQTTDLRDGEIAEIFDVSRVLINHIRNERRWDDSDYRPLVDNPFNPLKNIKDFMDTWNIDKLEYQNLKVFMVNE